MADTRASFESLPDELILGAGDEASIGKYLTIKDMGRVASSSKKLHRLFGKDLAKLCIEKLLSHVARGEEVEVLAMLEKNPQLLLAVGTTMDYSQRVFENITAFRLMLSAGNMRMVKKVKPYFARLQGVDGDDEKARQFNDQFPDGVQYEAPFDFDPILRAIVNSTFEAAREALANPHFDSQQENSDLKIAINQFREAFLPAGFFS